MSVSVFVSVFIDVCMSVYVCECRADGCVSVFVGVGVWVFIDMYV